jgi:predicted component of type VI protein secretion system
MKSRYSDGGKLPSAEEAIRMTVVEPVPKPKPEPKRRAKESAKPERPFRAEMLQGYGGSMKELPRDPEGAPMVTKAKGGTASSRADGCAQRGKTRGRMV